MFFHVSIVANLRQVKAIFSHKTIYSQQYFYKCISVSQPVIAVFSGRAVFDRPPHLNALLVGMRSEPSGCWMELRIGAQARMWYNDI